MVDGKGEYVAAKKGDFNGEFRFSTVVGPKECAAVFTGVSYGCTGH